MSGEETNLPLPQYYARTLRSLVPIFNDSISLSDEGAQATLSQAIDDLYLVSRMLTSLGVFSDNESVDEIGDKELAFMTVPWVLGQAEAKGGLSGYDQRKDALRRSETALNAFQQLLQSYKVLGSDEEAESSGGAGAAPADPAKRREAKIRAYRREKELKESISNALPGHPDPSSTPLEFILALLPGAPGERESSTAVNEEEPELRDASLLILRLLREQAVATLANNAMELDILAQAPPEPVQGPLDDPRARRIEDDAAEWRLDRKPAGAVKPRELISGGGRVLRPFTILPSTTALSDRQRLQSEVFRSSHRLPTMTIDEYLAEEQRRGNIITGGGQASYDAPTESELLELEAENDGSAAAEEAAEKKRQKDENWARFTDDNRKGAGNTMNRG
ncbi:hypothetical protein VHUM_03600 [Vanrija humicola]|uniref:TAP42-like protein n=1 Tax=Vanrija humicola TaxID=5417 RepID=A0A7D8Z1B6_VANHU|nr:hypothetical protein VHUM_03600 [Vanrija humicola]